MVQVYAKKVAEKRGKLNSKHLKFDWRDLQKASD
jgi:hypothetical protein